MIGFGQQTYVPDSNFEAYLEANGMGNNIPNDSNVFTSAIDTVTQLDAYNISDLTGIEDFTALSFLSCSSPSNQLTSLDVSTNTNLNNMTCQNNQLTSLDVSQNTALSYLTCQNNQLTSLDVSNHNVFLCCVNNPNLNCIDVYDVFWSTANFTVVNGSIDPQHYFSNNCSGTAIEEQTTNKELLKVTDLLGRETKQTNQPLLYIYDDGTVEKRIVIK